MDNINIWDISCNPVIDFSVNELINDTRITLIRCFNKNPIFDGNLLGLIESYDHIDDFTIIEDKHYRYFNQLSHDPALFYDICRGDDLDAVKYMINRGVTKETLNQALRIACNSYGNHYFIDTLIIEGATNLDECLMELCKYNSTLTPSIISI